MRLRVYAVVPGSAAQPQPFAFHLAAVARGEAPAQDRVNTEFSAPQAQ
jgi:hypothetical protein